ncbi:DUF7124 domain-containing protein [Natronomonas sp. EA1]|uniref:DUF7124 domain-containing protein n=1 Tax=Natronomonas sp. EA1 TaxID=3421655 RepID=UPI003EB994BB
MDDVTLTLAFELRAAKRLVDPESAFESARQWSQYVGIVSDRPPFVVTKFARDHYVENDFPVEPEPAGRSLEHMREHLDTGRHVFVGDSPEDGALAAEYGWEYQSIEEAAEAAGWAVRDRVDDASAEPQRTDSEGWP